MIVNGIPADLMAFAGLLQEAADPHKFNNYMVLGYAVMWLIGLVYVVTLANRQRNLQQDLRLLRQLLQEDEQPPAGMESVGGERLPHVGFDKATD